MLATLTNTPRDYAWGSTTLIAALQGREPTGSPEAEVWFGDHPGSPALLGGDAAQAGRPLDAWLAEHGSGALSYLLKLLAAASPLSIQVHPSKEQAEIGYAAENTDGIPKDAAHRTYRDDNHKPEVIVALSDRFDALAGLRDLPSTRRLIDTLGEARGVAELRRHLDGDDPRAALGRTLAWLLSGDAQDTVDDVIAALEGAGSAEFETELAAARRIAVAYPGDPGVVVALLMNHVVLARGEAIFVPAGVLHAYLQGLGVEIMAASDNVLRGGLTPKHIDVAELLRIVDTAPSAPPRLAPRPVADGVEVFAPGIPDFELFRVRVDGAPRTLALHGAAIALAVAGEVGVAGDSGVVVDLPPGTAAFATPDETTLTIGGHGEVFVAQPGR